jgi:hypothetical protein
MTMTLREAFEELVKGKPQFREVLPNGKAVIIAGARPPAPVAADDAAAPDDAADQNFA